MDEIRKSFALKKPCADCPFRNDDKAINLQEGRKEQILEDLLSGKNATFHCHKTVYRKGVDNFDEEGSYHPTDVAMCPGAMAVARKLGRDPQMIQVAERMGWIEPGHYDAAMEVTLEPSDLKIDPNRARLYSEDSD